ncbi:MAG: MtaA/CmuA family methyltransferase [Chloroflexi bacterium]|nr:MAG: MtaA/CmuA family methyltransferase [Chloroflexota bacterium]
MENPVVKQGKRPMSPKRRFLTALLGGQPDRVPVGNVVSVATMEQMKLANAWFPLAHSDADCMARLAAASFELLGFDTIMPVFSVTQEAEALGCQVDWGQPDQMPTVRSHPFAESSEFFLPKNWQEAPSIQVVLEALRRLRAQYSDRVVIVGKVMGPWTLSYHLMGLEEFLVSTKLEPERARRCLEALKVVPVAFARAQIQDGADIVCLADHATGGMVSPLAYRDFLLPLHQEIFGAIGAPTVLHCCGNTTDRIRYFAQSGVDCYHFESQVDIEPAVADARGKMTLIGNINNPTTLLEGTPEDVIATCQKAIAAGVDILSPECAVPLTTSLENLKAMVSAVCMK